MKTNMKSYKSSTGQASEMSQNFIRAMHIEHTYKFLYSLRGYFPMQKELQNCRRKNRQGLETKRRMSTAAAVAQINCDRKASANVHASSNTE
jgi:hypothetical protein